MVKVTTRFVGLLIVAVACLIVGFFLHDYLIVKKENAELRYLAKGAMDLAERRTVTINACMITLTSCSRLIENPQMFRQLQLEESFGIQLTHEVASGAAKQGSKEGMGPGGKGGVEAPWQDARKGGRD